MKETDVVSLIKVLGEISDTLKTLNESAKVIAVASAENALKDNTPLTNTLEEHQKLVSEDYAAWQVLKSASDSLKEKYGDIGLDERVKEFGEKEAKKQTLKLTKARNARKKTMVALNREEANNPNIRVIYRAITKKKSD